MKIASLGGMSHFSLLHSILAALVRHIYLISYEFISSVLLYNLGFIQKKSSGQTKENFCLSAEIQKERKKLFLQKE